MFHLAHQKLAVWMKSFNLLKLNNIGPQTLVAKWLLSPNSCGVACPPHLCDYFNISFNFCLCLVHAWGSWGWDFGLPTYPQSARTKANLAVFGEWHYLFCKLTLSGLPVCVSLSKDLKACLCVNALSLSIHNNTTILDLNLGFLLHWLSTTEF